MASQEPLTHQQNKALGERLVIPHARTRILDDYSTGEPHMGIFFFRNMLVQSIFCCVNESTTFA